MQFNWRIDSLDTDINTGVIRAAHWELSAFKWVDLEGGNENDKILHKEKVYGMLDFWDATSESEDFIDWRSVTEDQVIGWVKDSLGEEEVLKLEESVVNNLNLKITPETKTNLPWE